MSTYKRANMTRAPTSYHNCPEFLERYLEYLSSFCNRSPSTVVEYYTILREFIQYVHYRNRFHEPPPTKDAHKDMDITFVFLPEMCQVTQEDVEQYMDFLAGTVGNKTATLRKKLAMLREFYAYIDTNAEELEVSLLDGNPARFIGNPKTNVMEPKPLRFEQVEKVLASVFGDSALRDKAIILLIATTALTLREVVSLNRSDAENGFLTVRLPGQEPKIVHLTESCQEVLDNYLAESENHFEGDSALFKTSDGKNRRLTPRAIQFRISKTSARAGLPEGAVTAQTLRDTGAAFLLSSVPDNQRYAMLYYLGYSTDHATRRFAWLFPNVQEQRKRIAKAVRENPTYLAMVGESAADKTEVKA